MKKTILGALIVGLAIYLGAREVKVKADQENVHQFHQWAFAGMDPNREQLGYVFLDYDFKDVDRCVLQATAVRQGKNTILRIKCLKLP